MLGVRYSKAITNVNSIQPSDPAPTSSVTDVMMGLALYLRPTSTGKLLVIFDGIMTAPNDNGFITVRYGTGNAPSNGDAVTGTVASATFQYWGGVGFSRAVILANLTIGTRYWFDIAAHVAANGPITVSNIDCTAMEV